MPAHVTGFSAEQVSTASVAWVVEALSVLLGVWQTFGIMVRVVRWHGRRGDGVGLAVRVAGMNG